MGRWFVVHGLVGCLSAGMPHSDIPLSLADGVLSTSLTWASQSIPVQVHSLIADTYVVVCGSPAAKQAGFCLIEHVPTQMPLHAQILVGRKSKCLP